jgi:hypothetical protein
MNRVSPKRPPTARSPRRRRWLAAASLAVCLATALLTAACGGSPSSSGSPSTTGIGGSPNAGGSASSPSALAFARCVRAHGVPNFPDPDSSGHFNKQQLRQLGVSDSRLRAAQAPCQNLLPAGPPPLTAQEQQDYLRAAACMRSHGITVFPDPVFSGGGVSFPLPSSGVDTSSPQFTRAKQICEQLIPAGLPDSGRSGGGS